MDTQEPQDAAPVDPDEGRSPATTTSEDDFTGAFAPKQ